MLFSGTFYSSENPEKKLNKAAQPFFSIDNNNQINTKSQHIRRTISERSCDTKDWSNDAEKFCFAITGINYILEKFLLYF